MTFYEGDLVEIEYTAGGDTGDWIGLRARVVGQPLTENTQLTPEQDRPDGYGRNRFYWQTANLRLIERRTYQVGDRVVLKTREEFPDNIGLPDNMVGVVLTVTAQVGDLLAVVGPDAVHDDGYYSDRFKLAPPQGEPRPFAVGDRVRIRRAAYAEEAIGRSGTIVRIPDRPIDLGGLDHPWEVELDRAGTYHVAELEHLDGTPAPTTPPRPQFSVGDHVRIVRASEAAQAIGRSGTLSRVHAEPILIGGVPHPYEVRLDSGRRGRRGSTWHAAEIGSTTRRYN